MLFIFIIAHFRFYVTCSELTAFLSALYTHSFDIFSIFENQEYLMITEIISSSIITILEKNNGFITLFFLIITSTDLFKTNLIGTSFRVFVFAY